MKIYNYFMIFIVFLAMSANSQETTYPSGSNILSSYSVNSTEISIADTLIISRTVVNNEDFDLESLYFSENIPDELEVVGHNASIEGVDIDYLFLGPISNGVINGYNAYHWVIDSPLESESVTNILNPGDSILLEVKIVSSSPGIITLPIHTTIFSGNNSGFFSTSAEIEIEFLLSVDIENENNNTPSSSSLTGHAYPNPFNSAVKIWYSNENHINQQVDLNIYDILGKKVHSEKHSDIRDQSVIVWKPDYNTGSGIYFYRLSSGSESFNGKILFLK
ncbi:MAG: T9SS type A sorting domain-containing protein [candidate division Zixibacteria bacterium]|nr:T9SS type A sorting domain-containing protein [candidate division Zixibacteria bacterium]